MKHMGPVENRSLWTRNVLCIPFAAAMLILSSRTAVECISTLALAPSQSSGKTSARPCDAVALDRLPKPTRQQERTSIACLVQLKWLSLSKPVSPTDPVWGIEPILPAPLSKDWTLGYDGDRDTKPAYLRACDTVPRSQLPPPLLTPVFA